MKKTRLALVIGVSDYPGSAALANPVNDADDIATKLDSHGFDIIKVTNCKCKDMAVALEEFATKLDDYDTGLFFFAGHGMQIENTNYLIANDSENTSQSAAEYTSLSLDRVLKQMNKSKARTKIVMLDACRDDPWARAWSRDLPSNGLASVFAPKGTIIGFATSPGEAASDGKGRNGTYTSALLTHIDERDLPIEAMFKRVRNSVAAASKGTQTTWEHTSLSGDFYFNMSLTHLVGDYSENAFADANYVPVSGSIAEQVISSLKSHNWYVQNPVFASLKTPAIMRMTGDDLFVIGRNIYQAACGSSSNAINFVNNLTTSIRGWPPVHAKAVFDGILFEIFFDSNGDLRDNIKGEYFNEVYAHSGNERLRPSYDFIVDCLKNAGAKLIVIPGTDQNVSVSVTLTPTEDNQLFAGLYLAGEDILDLTDSTNGFDDKIYYSHIGQDNFEEQVSQTLKIPLRQLTITYEPKLEKDNLKSPQYWKIIT